MAYQNYKSESRKDWGQDTNGSLTIEQINCGAILRIADAVELMAKNYLQLQHDAAFYKRKYQEQQKEIESLTRSKNAYSGHVKRLKKKVAAV